MTKMQRGIVVASAIVTAIVGWVSQAQAAQAGGSCGIIYACATSEGCQFGSGPCLDAQAEQGCTGTYQSSWCSLLGCGGANGIACSFN
jgi:hypothetical protein